MVMIDTATPRMTAGAAVPAWLDGKNLRPIDRDASEHLEPYLELRGPLSLSLLEQAKNRLVEVRLVGDPQLDRVGSQTRCSSMPFNSRDYLAFWPDLVAAIQASISLRAPSWRRKRNLCSSGFGGRKGPKLYRMLWGYSPDQLADGGAAELVEALANPAMDIRVLAYENLYRIVEKTNSYRPEIDPNRQRREILNWQRDLETSQIIYKNNPLELDD